MLSKIFFSLIVAVLIGLISDKEIKGYSKLLILDLFLLMSVFGSLLIIGTFNLLSASIIVITCSIYLNSLKRFE